MNENIYPPVRFNLGRPPKYTPKQLAEKFVEYVNWEKEHPIRIKVTETSTSVQGNTYGKESVEEKPRLVSIEGFCIWMGETKAWWQKLDHDNAKHKDEFFALKNQIREYCEKYQKEMATSGLFNANIISRLLGLADRQQVEGKMDYTFNFGGEEK